MRSLVRLAVAFILLLPVAAFADGMPGVESPPKQKGTAQCATVAKEVVKEPARVKQEGSSVVVNEGNVTVNITVQCAGKEEPRDAGIASEVAPPPAAPEPPRSYVPPPPPLPPGPQVSAPPSAVYVYAPAPPVVLHAPQQAYVWVYPDYRVYHPGYVYVPYPHGHYGFRHYHPQYHQPHHGHHPRHHQPPHPHHRNH